MTSNPTLTVHALRGSIPLAIRRIRHRNYCGVSTRPRYEGPCFAFDIDGVISRGGVALPQALAALRTLHVADDWVAPVVFVTNGGGVTEVDRAKRLQAVLDVPVHESMVVLAHSPLRDFAPRYTADAAALTVGTPRCAHVARQYGFAHALDTSHFAAIHRAVTPFSMQGDVHVTEAERRAADAPLGAVCVMTDSRDWGRDVQILLDIFAPPHPQDHPMPDLYYCNSDILFPTLYARPRLAGGAFRVAFEAVFAKVTGKAPPIATLLGKPYAPNYATAEKALRAQVVRMGYDERSPLMRVFAVGDNPPSDVRGANARGDPWVSILVRTGNFTGKAGDIHRLDPAERPALVFNHIADAVDHVYETWPSPLAHP